MRKTGWLALACALAAFDAAAVDAVSVSAGQARRGDDVDIVQLGLQWNWARKWLDSGAWHVGGYWEARLGMWSGESPAGGNKDVLDVGFAPVFRLQPNVASGLAPYAEAGVGVHLLSERRIHAAKDMGSRYQFASHIGIGVRLGGKSGPDLSYRLQHYSNAGLKRPNPGIDFHQLRLQLHF